MTIKFTAAIHPESGLSVEELKRRATDLSDKSLVNLLVTFSKPFETLPVSEERRLQVRELLQQEISRRVEEKTVPIIPNSDEEKQLEARVFNLVNNSGTDLDQDQKQVIKDLWRAFVNREVWYEGLLGQAEDKPSPELDGTEKEPTSWQRGYSDAVKLYQVTGNITPVPGPMSEYGIGWNAGVSHTLRAGKSRG